jgi:integrase
VGLDRFSQRFLYHIRARQLPRVTVHGLRHMFATMALRSGTALKVASDLLAHASVNVTGDVYVNVLSDQHEAAAAKLGGASSAAIQRRANRSEAGDKSVTEAR